MEGPFRHDDSKGPGAKETATGFLSLVLANANWALAGMAICAACTFFSFEVRTTPTLVVLITFAGCFFAWMLQWLSEWLFQALFSQLSAVSHSQQQTWATIVSSLLAAGLLFMVFQGFVVSNIAVLVCIALYFAVTLLVDFLNRALFAR